VPNSIALAYVMRKQAYIFLLIDWRKVEYLKANIEALSVVLDEEDLRDFEKASDWPSGSSMMFLPLAENGRVLRILLF
jgi:aryl-alcohol dehydrogenase-like predicted oxidoreductase